MDAREFGFYIREKRRDLLLTQKEAASKIGMTQTNYAKYERGLIETMSTRTLGRLAVLYNIPRDIIIELVMTLSEQKYDKKVTLESLRNNPPRKYAASSSAKMTDEDAEYLHKQLEAINEEEEKGDWE